MSALPASSPGLSIAIDRPSASSAQPTTLNASNWNGRTVNRCRITPSPVLSGVVVVSGGSATIINTLMWKGVIAFNTTSTGVAAILGGVFIVGYTAKTIYTNCFSEEHALKQSNAAMRAASPVIEFESAQLVNINAGVSAEAKRFEQNLLTQEDLQKKNTATTNAGLQRLNADVEALDKSVTQIKSIDAETQHFETEMSDFAKQTAASLKAEEKTKGDINQMEHDASALEHPLAQYQTQEMQLNDSLKKQREYLENEHKQVVVHNQLTQEAEVALENLQVACADTDE